MGLPIVDTLRSLVTGLGTSKDKTVSQTFGLRLVDQAELSAMHRSDWLARKVVDIIPNDMTREWRDWQADSGQIEKIEALEKQFNVQPKLNLVLQMARLFGGAALYLGMKDGTPDQELMIDKVKAGDLQYVHVLSRYEATVGEINRAVTSPYYGEPSSYQVTALDGMTAKVHPSRMIRFVGAPILDATTQDNQGWGDSILQIVYDAIQNAASGQQHVAAMLPEAKADVIYIPNLSKYLQNATTTKQLTDRFTYANTIKSMFNMVLLEGTGGPDGQGEKWEQKQINFAQLPEIVRQFLQIASGAADIPVTRLLGESPGGLNATGQSDLKNYYDNIAARQRTELTPALRRLDEVLIRSALGTRDQSIYYEWSSLWGLSDTEKATIFKTKADAARAIAGTGTSPPLMPIEALSDALVNAFTEDGSLPGLEAAIDEYGKLSEQEPDEDELMAAAAANSNEPQRMAANDAAPRTLYVRRDVINTAEIERWAKSQGFTDVVPDLHVTIAFSRTPVDWFKVGTSWSPRIEIAKGGPRQIERLGPDGKYIALLITASELVWRHKEIVENGASWDWPDYQPHISIQIGGEVDLTKVEPYQGRIVLGPEIFEEVREG